MMGVLIITACIAAAYIVTIGLDWLLKGGSK